MRGGTVALISAAIVGWMMLSGKPDVVTAPTNLSPVAVPTSPLVAAPPAAAIASPPAEPTSPLPVPATKSDKAGPTKKNVEKALTAAAIAALIVAASRSAYHADGRPCACPDDRNRSGRKCGGNSAYLRQGGAAPLCYLKDVSVAMILAYRSKSASR